MPLLVHLCPERVAPKVLRQGIRGVRWSYADEAVFAMPWLPDYFTTHQWLRELKRRGDRTILAVDFRLSDEEPVLTLPICCPA